MIRKVAAGFAIVFLSFALSCVAYSYGYDEGLRDGIVYMIPLDAGKRLVSADRRIQNEIHKLMHHIPSNRGVI